MRVNDPRITNKFVWKYICEKNYYWSPGCYIKALNSVGWNDWFPSNLEEISVINFIETLDLNQLHNLYNELRKIPTK